MYDTVSFWKDRVDTSGGNPFEVLPYLTGITERKNAQEYSCTGTITGYNVFVSDRGLWMVGSLAKMYFEGDNVPTMTRKSTELAIQKLCDEFHTDMRRAHVKRIDVASVIPTKRPPTDYFGYLGSKAYFKRLQAALETLYYNNHQRQLVFYDKKKESITVPESWNNVLRYEYRLLKRINKQMKADVRAETLYNEDFYMKVVFAWRDEFKSIQKIKEQSFNMDNITTVRDAETALFAHLLQQSGQGIIDDFLNELKANSIFKERPRYSELKKRLQTYYESPAGTKSELVQELESSVNNIARYAR